MSEYTCDHCKDTHIMRVGGDYAPCTHCPVPCTQCSSDDSRNAFCEKAPCPCECHKKYEVTQELARSDMVHPTPDYVVLYAPNGREEYRDRLLLELSRCVLRIMSRTLPFSDRKPLEEAIKAFESKMT